MKRFVLYPLLVLVLCLATGMGIVVYRLDHRTVGEYFDSNGVRIHYTREGSGPPVILVHGFSVNADLNWRRTGVIDALKDKYTVIAMDNRGHGLSGKPVGAEHYGVQMVEDVVRLMDHLNLPKAHVIGYSMGGFITLKLLTLHPDRLLSAAPCAAGWGARDERRQELTDLAQSLESGRGFTPLLRLLEPDGQPRFIKVWATNRILMHVNEQGPLASVIRGFPEFLVEEQALRDNKVPVLSVVGGLDPLKDGIDRMKGVMANHQIVVLEDEDHITTMAHPEFIRALRSFLDQQEAAAPAGEIVSSKGV